MYGVINVVFSRLMCDVRKAEFTHAGILPLQNNLLLLPLVVVVVLLLLGLRFL